MLDLLFVLAGLGFFIVAILYVVGGEWLIKDQGAAPAAERIETTGQQASGQQPV